MNDLKDLVITLEGYSVNETGFEITDAHKGKGNFWSLFVKAYKKEGEGFFSESNESMLLTLVNRIESKYGKIYNRWAVVKVDELTPGSFALIVKKVTDEKEGSSDKEEHMESEE